MKKILLSLIIIFSIFFLFGCNNKEKLDSMEPFSYKLLEDGTYEAQYDDRFFWYARGVCLEIPNKYEGKKVTRFEILFGFDKYEAIRKIIISKNITYINIDEFSKLSNLKEIEVNRKNQTYSSLDGVLYSKDKTELIYFPRAIGGEIRFPLSLSKIGSKAFSESRTLISIEIPKSITEIGDYAFYNCHRLQNINFAENCIITKIGDYAFADCDGLWTITLPKSLKLIGRSAFEDCVALTTINFNGESQLEEIQSDAFRHCDILKEISISNKLKFIGSGAFYGCKKLEIIHYSGTVEEWNRIEIDSYNENFNNAKVYFAQ